MSLSRDSLSSIPASYATVSIGTPQHPLREKLDAIAAAGFQGIELGFPDLVSFATDFHKQDVGEQDFDKLCEAGKEVKTICEELGLKIVMLQPFATFEGWAPRSPEREDAFRRANGWIRVMEAVGTDMIQVGSSDALKISSLVGTFASDLKELADLLAAHKFRLAYENWCWATHAPSWKDVWQIVQRVDRPNVGLCLDTFQTAGGEWGDPTTESGLIESKGREDLEKRFKNSLEELSKVIPQEKIYLLQISDAYKPETPLDPDPDETGLRPKGRWSMSLRPMPFDGGYLPIVDVARAVLQTGFRGWFSMEIFDGGPQGTGRDWNDMRGFARKAMESHKCFLDAVTDS